MNPAHHHAEHQQQAVIIYAARQIMWCLRCARWRAPVTRLGEPNCERCVVQTSAFSVIYQITLSLIAALLGVPLHGSTEHQEARLCLPLNRMIRVYSVGMVARKTTRRRRSDTD